MVYNNRLVAVVQCGGKVLRERGDTVYLPFNSEYQIMLKNLNSRKAKINITIDGQDVFFGKSLILGPNETQTIERFVNNLNEGNRFRFIEKTEEISKYRGDRPDDGLVRIQYWFEKLSPTITWTPWNPPFLGGGWTYTSCGNLRGSKGSSAGADGGFIGSADAAVVSCYAGEAILPRNDSGITVPGSMSSQQFGYGYIGELEPNSEVIVIRLSGGEPQQPPIQKPLFVSNKLTCNTCGRVSPSTAKFCSNCSTALVIK
jgi:hypothetical protein